MKDIDERRRERLAALALEVELEQPIQPVLTTAPESPQLRVRTSLRAGITVSQ